MSQTTNQLIPDGYKQTEAGIIPEDWELMKFGDLFELSITRKRLKPEALTTFVGMQDVSESAQLISPSQKLYKSVKSGFTYFEKNDVLLAKITPCFENGKGCHTQKLETEIGFGSTEFHALRAKKSSDSKFIYFWTTRNSFRQDLESEMVGSAGHRRVPLLAIQNYKIPCPAKGEEQTAIANALSDVDALLSELEKFIAKKQAIKTATMQQLLTGKTRLPAFAFHKESSYAEGPAEGNRKGQLKGSKHSELGEIPEDWCVVKMGDISNVNQGLQIEIEQRKSYQSVISKPYITIQSLKSSEPIEYIDEYSLAVCCTKDEILMTRTGNTGIVVTGVTGVFHNNFFKIVYKKAKLDKDFFVYFLRSSGSKKRILDKAGTSTIPDLNHSDFYSLPIILPSKKEQTAIATILSDMDEEIQTLGKRLTKTRQIKQGMMQELLTGKTRLPFDKLAVNKETANAN